LESTLLDVYRDRNPWCTRASGWLDAAEPSTVAADAGVTSRSPFFIFEERKEE
jgi:hypothetical protein